MTQREELNEDQKKLNWLLGLEKETLADMAHQQSKIIEKLQKAAKAQAVTCPNVNETINNSMPRGYMLNTLIKFQKWRIGEDVRTLDETGLTPRSITLAIDWAIEQLDKYKTQAVPQWIPVSEGLPKHDPYVLVVQESNNNRFVVIARFIGEYMEEYDGADGHFSDYKEDTDTYYIPSGWYEQQVNWDEYSEIYISDKITHWMPLPVTPEQQK